MILPLWAICGIAVCFLSSANMLVQDKFRIKGIYMAYWSKVFCALFTALPAIYLGFPDQPHFYTLLFLSAVIFAFADVIVFNEISKSGAAVVSRILPISVILTFILWLPFDTELIEKYKDTPIRSLAIFAVICLCAYCSMLLKKCEISWGVIKAAWFVIVAKMLGPVLTKLMFEDINYLQAALSYVFLQSIFMVTMWTGFIHFNKELDFKSFISFENLKAPLLVGFFMSMSVPIKMMGYAYAENPAYTTAIVYLAPVMIAFYYRINGKKDDSNAIAGMGIVFSAIVLILLNSV